jgi:hypothetical protein
MSGEGKNGTSKKPTFYICHKCFAYASGRRTDMVRHYTRSNGCTRYICNSFDAIDLMNASCMNKFPLIEKNSAKSNYSILSHAYGKIIYYDQVVCTDHVIHQIQMNIITSYCTSHHLSVGDLFFEATNGVASATSTSVPMLIQDASALRVMDEEKSRDVDLGSSKRCSTFDVSELERFNAPNQVGDEVAMCFIQSMCPSKNQEEKEFRCDRCQKLFTTKFSLTRHTESSNGACDKILKYNKKLDRMHAKAYQSTINQMQTQKKIVEIVNGVENTHPFMYKKVEPGEFGATSTTMHQGERSGSSGGPTIIQNIVQNITQNITNNTQNIQNNYSPQVDISIRDLSTPYDISHITREEQWEILRDYELNRLFEIILKNRNNHSACIHQDTDDIMLVYVDDRLQQTSTKGGMYYILKNVCESFRTFLHKNKNQLSEEDYNYMEAFISKRFRQFVNDCRHQKYNPKTHKFVNDRLERKFIDVVNTDFSDILNRHRAETMQLYHEQGLFRENLPVFTLPKGLFETQEKIRKLRL